MEKGVIYTKDWVANLMLDLAGYDQSIDLAEKVAVDPSCGTGVFVIQMAKRLIKSCKLSGHSFGRMMGSIKAFDLCATSVNQAKDNVRTFLIAEGIVPALAQTLADTWIIKDDFLLMSESIQADFIVGNPPYIRSNDIEECKKSEYLKKRKTMTPGSDLYIGFFDKSLSMLKPFGKLSFICADRWMHNSYGKKLRKYIVEEFSVDSIMLMHDVDAFESSVAAYPAITVISKTKANTKASDTIYIEASSGFNEREAVKLIAMLGKAKCITTRHYSTGLIPEASLTEGSWPLLPPDKQAVLCHLEKHFQMLESPETGTYVGIGMATGNDGVFLTSDEGLVEPEYMIPMVTSRQLKSGNSDLKPLWLVNPWNGDESLADLSKAPKLNSYFSRNREVLEKRHVAKKDLKSWYRTIDRYHAGIEHTPKLLIQDMHYRFEPYLDTCHYPHGNLYYITSEKWDLEVLGGLLMSSYCELFIDAYGVKMRGGTLRFQTQFLRKIRVPNPDAITPQVKAALKRAFKEKNYSLANESASCAFGFKENKIAV